MVLNTPTSLGFTLLELLRWWSSFGVVLVDALRLIVRYELQGFTRFLVIDYDELR